MTDKEKQLIDKIEGLFNEISCYISNNEDWPYYFLSTDKRVNSPIHELIENNPQDWRDCIDFDIKRVAPSSVEVNIKLCDDQDTCLNRIISLPHFSEFVEGNKKLVEQDINELQIKDLKAEIEYYKKRIAENEQELERLEKGAKA